MMRTSDSSRSSVALRKRVLTALAGSRIAGLHFPGYLMGLRWRGVQKGTERATLSFSDGDWCRDAAGSINLPALAILVDTALATTSRTGAELGARMATVSLAMQFTGVPLTGHFECRSRFMGHARGEHVRESLSHAVVTSDGEVAAYADGAFVLLPPPSGVKLAPLPWQQAKRAPLRPLKMAELEAHERQVLARCDEALAAATPAAPFIDHFWAGVPHAVQDGAALAVDISPHLGNRVGHVQGGVQVGLAARTALAALPPRFRLSNCSAWFVSPGRGARLHVRARVLHEGRSFALVHSEIRGAENERILETTCQFVAR
jgi:acyl-coenzyme A thioesterase PaaI-like protein